MAGHSKWANIKHRKAKVDAQKGAVFAKFSREIIIAAREGGSDPAGNFRLRTAIDKAKSAGLPNDNIKRAIEKAGGLGGESALEAITYEGYAPGGVAIIVDALTDNRNRTAGDIRSYFNKYGGNLGETGCVSWIFKTEGIIDINSENIDSEQLFDFAINAGAEDFSTEENLYKISTLPENLQTVAEALEKFGYIISSAEIVKTPQNIVAVENMEIAKPLFKLLENIENHDDVQNVYTNFEMNDILLEEMEKNI